VDAAAVDRLRAALSGTAWIERTASFARALRSAGHDPGGLLLVGTPDEEPWHLAAHLDEQARYADLPLLRPTLVRWAPPPGAPAHLSVGLDRLNALHRGETLFLVTPDAPPERLLERVADARRGGAIVLALDGSENDDLAGLAHESLVVPATPSSPSVDAVGHLLSAATAAHRRRRSLWRR
jgi:hypothetical protein